MKSKILLLLFILFCSSAFAQYKTSLTEQKLKGQVIAVTDKIYAVNDTVLKPESSLFSKTISKYNEKGFLIEMDAFNKNEELIAYNTYKFDTIKGYKLEDKGYFPDSSFKEKYVYKYDAKGNLIEEKIFENRDSLKPALINTYDIKTKDEPEFDSDEEKIDIVITTKHKNFDKFGNWQTEITYEKKVPISITLRTIEYYVKPKQED